MRITLFLSILLTIVWSAAVSAETVFDLQTARLLISEKGLARLELPDATPWPAGTQPIFEVATGADRLSPESVSFDGNHLAAAFPGGGICEFTVHPNNGFAVFELTRLEFPAPVQWLRLCFIPLPQGAEIMNTLNAGGTPENIVALSAAEPNVHAFTESVGRFDANRDGCTHTFALTDQVKIGQGAAHFPATSDAQPGGWAMSGMRLAQTLNLTGLKSIRAWVHGDGKGELLKIQLADGFGGNRDTYIPITFEGWQQVNVMESSVNTLQFAHTRAMNIYYNGLPAGQTVSCIVDHIEAILDHDGQEMAILLEDFEPTSSYWAPQTTALALETLAVHGLQPARFGILACPRDQFLDTMERFETAAGLPSPKPGGAWNKKSEWIKQSYLFITSYKESQFEDVLALARRGGFGMILMGQESWTKSTGHYEVNTDNFPGGLDALARTFQRFKQEGFHIGLHFLGASIYPPDPYLAPVPDPRLVRDAEATLAADIDDKAAVLPVAEPPVAFPTEDGGYMGYGTVLQIGDELISYGARAVEPPFGFTDCTRGILGTAAAPHAKGQPVRHLQRSYGYFLYDMDTTLIDEVASNFARVANACDIDMIYFDGSERLQGDHWYYNARLHRAFYDELARKDILFQASSFSHYSWHLLARSASADGHGDLKGYLDERSGWLDAFKRDAMPLDIGWYYGYDASCTPDMYEYVLGATIGYDSSMSFQVSLDAASKHPFTGEILDLIARYEKLRMSGRVPGEMRARLRIDPVLTGQKTPEERATLLEHRREYRLLAQNGQDIFQRVSYDPWHTIVSANPQELSWTVRVPQGRARAGMQIHVLPGPWLEAGPSYRAAEAVTLESFGDLAPYLKNHTGQQGVRDIPNGAAGATLGEVVQHIRLDDQNAKEGGQCAEYAAESTRATNDGWTVFGKNFEPPLNLSSHKAIGFWLRGDAKGGQFKLQLLDGAKAADFYVANDYMGWRYQQLPRPVPDPIDYAQVRTLNFYYNGLPGKTTITCAIDDVKALPAVDTQTLVDPWMDVAGHRLAWKGALMPGQYVFLWPGELPKLYGPAFSAPALGAEPVPELILSEGNYAIHFGHGGATAPSLRVRLTLQADERYVIP